MNAPLTGTWMVGLIGTEIDGSIVAGINKPIVKGLDRPTGTKTSRYMDGWSHKIESVIGTRTDTLLAPRL